MAPDQLPPEKERLDATRLAQTATRLGLFALGLVWTTALGLGPAIGVPLGDALFLVAFGLAVVARLASRR